MNKYKYVQVKHEFNFFTHGNRVGLETGGPVDKHTHTVTTNKNIQWTKE